VSLKEHICLLTRYSAWADQVLYQTLAVMDEAQLAHPKAGRSKGVLGGLGHNMLVDRIWQANLLGLAHGMSSRALQAPMSLSELANSQQSLDAWMIDYAANLDEFALTHKVAFTYVSGEKASMLRSEMILHTVNHKTYHRGYVADMLYEIGGKPPSMDLNVFLKHPTY
jgi:uncharacterized damage-inducible protein DinB